MTNTNDMREAFDLWSEQHGEEPIFPLQVWEAACQWQSQQAQGEPVGWIVTTPSGYKKRPRAILRSDYDVESPEFWHGGVPPEDATIEPLYLRSPSPAAVPEFDKKLFDSECRESVAGALGFPRGGDYAWSYLLAQIKEVVEAAGRLPASPAPAAVPDEAFNLIEAIRAELTWPGWRKTSSRDWVMDSVSELLSMLTASPHPAETEEKSRD